MIRLCQYRASSSIALSFQPWCTSKERQSRCPIRHLDEKLLRRPFPLSKRLQLGLGALLRGRAWPSSLIKLVYVPILSWSPQCCANATYHARDERSDYQQKDGATGVEMVGGKRMLDARPTPLQTLYDLDHINQRGSRFLFD